MILAKTLIFLNIAIFAAAMIVMVYSYAFRRVFAVRMLMILALAFCVVSFCTLNVYVSQALDEKILFSHLRFLGLSILGPSWLLFVSSVFSRWNWLRKKWVIPFLYLPAAITITLTLIPEFRSWVTTDFSPTTVYGLSVVSFRGGPWLKWHITCSYVMILLAVGLSTQIFLREQTQKRRQILILVVGCLSASLIDIYCIVENSPLRWAMLSSGTFLLNQAAIVYATFRHRLLDIAPLALEKVFNDIPDPILVTDSHGYLRAMNETAKTLFKLDSSSQGRLLQEELPQIDLKASELRMEDDLGIERVFSIKIERLTENTADSALIAVFHDVTNQKQVEDSLNENLEFKARLLSLMAHDLVGNLKNQTLLSQAIQKQVLPEYQGMANLLSDSTLASQDLMTNVLRWAKSQENRFEPNYKRFELNILIAECLEALAPTAELKSISFKCGSSQNPILVNGDSEMIASVIRNLLSNAVRASHHGRTIQLRVQIIENDVQVTVIDEGVGMTSDQLAAAMAPSKKFFDRKEESSSGYGIGLKIAHRFVDLHAGKFWLESQSGRGTSAHFKIPL